ncbi:hypothetical protein BJ742DRAFT_852172 [Cladochytrium replicatum]|nr:hypothetical protein BJ742DRAFT_852172 [Cladochytrium replicatum]
MGDKKVLILNTGNVGETVDLMLEEVDRGPTDLRYTLMINGSSLGHVFSTSPLLKDTSGRRSVFSRLIGKGKTTPTTTGPVVNATSKRGIPLDQLFLRLEQCYSVICCRDPTPKIACGQAGPVASEQGGVHLHPTTRDGYLCTSRPRTQLSQSTRNCTTNSPHPRSNAASTYIPGAQRPCDSACIYWNWLIHFGMVASPFLQSLAIFGSVYFIASEGTVDPVGYSVGHWVQCHYFGTPVLITVLLKSLLMIERWTWGLGGVLDMMKYVEAVTSIIARVLPTDGWKIWGGGFSRTISEQVVAAKEKVKAAGGKGQQAAVRVCDGRA